MGVQGLSSLLEKHRRIYREVRFRRSRLLIDGCNLLYLLYFSSGLDQNHGGEYASFEVLIEKFVKALRDCGISPYVVLDGGSDYTDKKLKTVTLRAKDRVKKAHRAAQDNRHESILPLLVKLVFKQTLARLEVPLAQCYGEADQEIAAMATEWRCPVLSKDSDFYIFDLPAGLLPLSDFRWEAVQRSGSQSFISCKSYNTSSFCIFFSLQQQLLPTFAALAGNDYVKLQRTESSISWAQFAPEGSGVTSRLEGLLRWLRGFQGPQDAFEAALGLMGDLSSKRKAELLKDLYLGMEEYQLPPCSLNKFFIHGTAPPFPAEEEVAGLVPDWTRLPLTRARLTPDILDVLLLRRMPLSIVVDHADTASANLISRPLRQVMYGLLLGDGTEVTERDRDGLQLKFIPVRPAVTRASKKLVLTSPDQVEPSQRLQVLLEALQVTEDSLSRLPPQLRLPLAVTCYWLQRAQPPPDKELLKALLLGLSTGDSTRPRTALQNQNHHRRPDLDLVVVHAFNQWQSCLKTSIHLNQLLGFPLPEPQISRLYEGSLVHQLVHRMRSGGKLRPFVKNDRSSLKLYQTFQAVVHQFHTQEASASSETQKTALASSETQKTALASSETQKTASDQQQPPLDDLTVNLQQLFLLNEDAEAGCSVRVQEDLRLGALVSVRTRYRAKERNNRCKNPELARKEECRGRDLL
ncbi:protein asteroid homolog 1-like [Anoplopoma fimbria]|uniref:protein asteroid homolog 1-like n=1 Tax=Anoplopoma fimbria TaxID=229290 RepID=UPI0023EB92FF|nr:protein asteroid homolog 1-like [Anoplopoma fimbria]